ncbi:MAG: hypothetical protein G01um101466_270 [Parcubacteria group bacterium Gr01-1014_66]|nr:MAG: hypothetical protein G01um101466_270 [Parcubacteria group bacterium Gr01-1014_66]
MEDLFNILLKRIRDKDPALTPQKLQDEIANCVGTKINEYIKQIMASAPISLLQKTLKDAFDFSCEIDPSLSLYIKVSKTSSNQETPVESFSPLPFEESLAAIAGKDFSLVSSDEILDETNYIINQTSELFIHNVFLRHPLFMEICRKFMEVFHEQPNILLRDGVKVFVESKYLQKETDSQDDGHRGTYL